MTLKEAREAKGITLRELSALTEINISHLSQIENSDLSKMDEDDRNVTIKSLHRIAKALGCKLIVDFKKT